MILCPYHIEKIEPRLVVREKSGFYFCPICDNEIPRYYVEEKNIPRSTIEVFGFSYHGKDVYLTSLFYLLSLLQELEWRNNYFFNCLDDYTLQTIFRRIEEFKEHFRLPIDNAPRWPPLPLLVCFHNIPYFGDWFLCIYDLPGKMYERDHEVLHDFVVRLMAHSDVSLFIVSIKDCGEKWPDRMQAFLEIYINAVYNMQVNLKRKHLIVILTKADLLENKGSSIQLSDELISYIKRGSYKEYLDLDRSYLKRLKENSNLIKKWLREKGCSGFTNMAEYNFKSVEYTIISSTGAAPVATPVGMKLATKLEAENPKRVLDPFIWILVKTYPRIRTKLKKLIV